MEFGFHSLQFLLCFVVLAKPFPMEFGSVTTEFEDLPTTEGYLKDERDIAEPNLYNDLETTSTISAYDEELITQTRPVQTMNFPTSIQDDVLVELENIWNYSKSLQDDEADLKKSLESLVELTHARVLIEPEETLDRVKYLLGKLRQTLDGDDDKSGRLKRHIGIRFSDEGLEDEHFFTSNILEQLQTIINEDNEYKVRVTSTTLPSISASNIVMGYDKVIGEPIITTEIPILENVVNDTFGVRVPFIPPPSIFQILNNSNCVNTITNRLQPNSANASDESSMQNMGSTGGEIENSHVVQACFLATLQNTTHNLVLGNGSEVDKIETLHFLPLPSYFDEILGQRPTSEEVIAINSTSADEPSDLFDYHDDIHTEELTGETSGPMVLTFLEELTAPSEVAPVFDPAAMINGTRDGLIDFVLGFNRLRKPKKIIIIFIITIVIIVGGNALYQWLPQPLFGALLSSLLPLLLLLLLENTAIRKPTFKKNMEWDIIVDQILDAIKKYEDYSVTMKL